LKPKIRNESLHQDSNDNYVRIVNLPIINLIFKSTMSTQRNIHKYTPGPLLIETITARLITY